MAYENLCMYCFEDTGGETVCPHCGRDSRTAVPQVQLLPGTIIYGGRFLVGRALGQDANGVVYTALDLKLQRKLRIREYFPRDCASRLSDGTVVPAAGAEDAFETGLKRVKASVQNAENPANRHFFFEENGTGYIVQRKSAAAARTEEPEEEEELEESAGPNVKAIVGVSIAAVVIVGIVVFAIIRMLGGAMDQTNGIPDVTQEEEWQPLELPTATPYVAATIGANVDYNGDDWKNQVYGGNVDDEFNEQVQNNATPIPTTAPTPTPYAGLSTSSTISSKSSTQEIKDLQIVLAQQGWLDAADITGKYDTTTRNAVKAFQAFMNANYDLSEKLSVDGIAGPKTLSCLVQYDYSRNPDSITAQPTVAPTPNVTVAPTPRPTDVPSVTIDENSSSDAISDVQTMLISLNMLDVNGRNGFYDAATRNAVLAFQVRVNELFGRTVLNTTGTVDSLTLDYMKLYADRYGSTTPAPDNGTTDVPQATEEPTTQPTDVPQVTEEPQETDEPHEDGSITPDSDVENITALQNMLAKYGFLAQSQVDGVFGAKTTEALTNFQKYINALQGSEVLAVTGNADSSTLDMLLQMEEINTRTQIDENASVEQIAQLQKRLVELKWLNISGPTQAYDDITRAAVTNFQNYINSQSGIPCPVQVTGIADPLTLEYLALTNGKVVNPNPDAAVTAVPEAPQETQVPEEPVETETPPQETQVPEEPVETDVPSEENPPEDGGEDSSIGADSDSENITALQNELARYGFLSSSDVDGSYGDKTASAVSNFQKFVNLYKGEEVLSVTGKADSSTLDWLLQMEDELPYGTISSSSSGSGVTKVQQRLIALKWLPEGADTGEYDENTRQAVEAFQNYINSMNPPLSVRVTGNADVVTQQYLLRDEGVNPNPVSSGDQPSEDFGEEDLPEDGGDQWPEDEFPDGLEEDTENPNQGPTPVIADTVASTLKPDEQPE
ncbi:MAG: peptidoglycan-binding domain-containing protein, partial [Clostridia bacterium]|nr:peptidoglycan-binding domain-containing protein [Clostridia bacterium]